jgi:hypothetical protein
MPSYARGMAGSRILMGSGVSLRILDAAAATPDPRLTRKGASSLVEVAMWSMLIAVAWAGAGSSPGTGSATVTDFAVSLALTALVAWLARDHTRAKTRRRDQELAAALPAPGVH